VQLRPYQNEAVEAVEAAWARGVKRPAVVLPTGSGKTVIFSAIAKRAVANGDRVVILVHREELALQAEQKLLAADPMLHTGIVKAGRNDIFADVMICSIQTLARPGRTEALGGVHTVIYDEAHTSRSPSAMGVLERLDCFGEDVKTVGVTATMVRADGKALGEVWEEIVYSKDIAWAVENGYLSDARGISVPIKHLDLDGVKKRGGDYVDSDLAQAMLNAHASKQIAKAFDKYATGRRAIAFAPTVATAQDIADALCIRGIPAEIITGKHSREERQAIYARHESGETQVISSVSVLIEGYDAAYIDAVLMCRPTKSKGLYIQAVGRGLRPYPGKTDCLIIDCVGASKENNLATIVDLVGAEPKEGQTIREALDEIPEEEREKRIVGLTANGQIEVEEFDPFARSRAMWLKTEGGKMFIPTDAERLVFLLGPIASGDYVVGECSSKSRRDATWITAKTGVPMEDAMDAAEVRAAEINQTSMATKQASWRRRGTELPTVSQLGFAHKIGVEADGMSKRELSDAISIKLASRVLD
jgi:superfamily II DNA or RNA helicase